MNIISALVNPEDDEWVLLVGRYIMNMGAAEATTRLLIALCERNDRAAAMTADLPSRLGYLRKRFPRQPQERHSWAMNALAVASKHVAFRNVVAHSPLMITSHPDGTKHIEGILNLTPTDDKQAGELISLAELRGRVDESAKLGELLLEMQADFGRATAASQETPSK
jgi:hypothetical protein